MVEAFIRIGFLEIRIIDLLDIVLVGFLIYQVYRLIRGSLAYNIFIGLLTVYLLSLLFNALDMQLISQILGQFIGVGVLALLIVFQPEVRRFLLYIGRGSELRRRDWIKRLRIPGLETAQGTEAEDLIPDLSASVLRMSRKKIGALIVFSRTSKLQFFANTGQSMDSQISGKLLESIFEKNSPLHDGAVIIADGRILAAACILPISENQDLGPHVGLRHRAAVGITEHSDAFALLVSEERGWISYAHQGQLHSNVNENELPGLLSQFWAAESA